MEQVFFLQGKRLKMANNLDKLTSLRTGSISLESCYLQQAKLKYGPKVYHPFLQRMESVHSLELKYKQDLCQISFC